jgi:hypothetical protein
MSQRYPDINSPHFGQQARFTIVELVLEHLSLGIEGSKIDDRLALDILCYASVKRISIESACMELAGAPSGNPSASTWMPRSSPRAMGCASWRRT